MPEKELQNLVQEYRMLVETIKIVLTSQEAFIERIDKIERRLDILIGSSQEAKNGD